MLKLVKNDDLGKFTLRITLGILMMFHGVDKVINTGSIAFTKGNLSKFGLPEFIAYGVYIGEILAPLMIIFGVFTRIGGWIIVVNMVFAIVLVHGGDLLSLSKHGGLALELQWFYLFCGLAVALLGSGRAAIRPD